MDEKFWTSKYNEKSTGWDIGHISTPLKEYFDQIQDKNTKILIPGAGNSYEGEYLWRNGFKNVYIIDISMNPIENFMSRVPDFPREQLLHQDFFALEDSFDLIIEQTFFCALEPKLRSSYAKKMHELLSPGGKLVGLLFNFPLTEKGPPFGGDKKEYTNYFKDFFQFDVLAEAYNSIKPREGNEYFIKLIKKD